MGTFALERAYYHCRSCGKGTVPWDEVLDLSRQALTPGASEVICVAGAVDSFGEAAKVVLKKLAGLRVSESTAQRTSEAVGHDIGTHLAAGATFGAAESWAWHKDAEGKTVAYISADSTGVGQQGPGGAKADGRMANVAVFYNPVPESRAGWSDPSAARRPAWQARYVASLDSFAELGTQLRRQGAQIGMNEAERWIAISDGGNGLEDFLRMNFPRVEAVILDFYHAAEHLGNLAKVWHPREEAAAAELHERWCHQLKHEGGAALLATLRTLTLRGRSPAARQVYENELRYFENQLHRMDYPTYQAKGWQIGSGPVESACKRVVGQRLKGAGMRWSADGANGVCQLRALFLSESSLWAAFWNYAA